MKHISPENHKEVVKTLALRLFTIEELCTRSISGKKSALGADKPREPLDGHRMSLLVKLMREKCPGVDRKIMIEKLQNVQKVLRRGQKN